MRKPLRILKQFFLFGVMFLGLMFLFRGWIYRHFITYESIGVRNNYPVNDEYLIAYNENNSKNFKDANAAQIINHSLYLTTKRLGYSFEKAPVDPNELIYSHKANCIGYVSFFASICNYLFSKYSRAEHWQVQHQIGLLSVYGVNTHHYFSSPYFKDHDFVTIKNRSNGETFAVDPTLNDYSGIKFVSYKSD